MHLQIRQAIVLLSLLALLVLGDYDASDDVVGLNPETFKQVIAANDFVLVEFFAPWCVHCQELEPIYKEAAKGLKGFNVVVAAIDGDKYEALAKEQSVDGFPILRFYCYGNAAIFQGNRENSGDIIEWVQARVDLAAKELTTREQVSNFLSQHELSVTVFVGNQDSRELKSVALVFPDIKFAFVYNTELGKEHGIIGDSGIILIKPFDEGKDILSSPSLLTIEIVRDFVENNRYPLILPFNSHNSKRILENKHGVILFVFRDDNNNNNDFLQELAETNRHRLFVSTVNTKEIKFLQWMGIKPLDFPTAIIQDKKGKLKYKMEGDLNYDNLKAFISKFFLRKLKPFIKSEPIPLENNGPVITIVSKTFDSIVLNKAKHVFLVINAPDCETCDAFEPIWYRVAENYSDDKHIVVAKMDGILNEIPQFEISTFPSIYFFPSGRKSISAAKLYKGKGTFSAIHSWMLTMTGFEGKFNRKQQQQQQHVDEL